MCQCRSARGDLTGWARREVVLLVRMLGDAAVGDRACGFTSSRNGGGAAAQTRSVQRSARPAGADGWSGTQARFWPRQRRVSKRVNKEARRRRKVRNCRRRWRCELARIIDARDVRDPRDKGLGTHTSGHQLGAALARLHLASRFRLEVKWHVASNRPAERSQIPGSAP